MYQTWLRFSFLIWILRINLIFFHWSGFSTSFCIPNWGQHLMQPKSTGPVSVARDHYVAMVWHQTRKRLYVSPIVAVPWYLSVTWNQRSKQITPPGDVMICVVKWKELLKGVDTPVSSARLLAAGRPDLCEYPSVICAAVIAVATPQFCWED